MKKIKTKEEKEIETKAENIVEDFYEVYKEFRLYNRSDREEYHIKEYLKHIVRKHL